MTNKNNRRAALICSAPVIIDFLISQQVFFQLLHGTEYMLRADLNDSYIAMCHKCWKQRIREQR